MESQTILAILIWYDAPRFGKTRQTKLLIDANHVLMLIKRFARAFIFSTDGSNDGFRGITSFDKSYYENLQFVFECIP